MKVVRNAVHLVDLEGKPTTTQNIGNVYPYNVHQDDVLEKFDRRWLEPTDEGDALGDVTGHMVVLDLSDENGRDFRIGKVKSRIDRETFMVQYYETNTPRASMHLRKYFPNWYVMTDSGATVEKNQEAPPDGAIANETTFKISELLYKPSNSEASSTQRDC